MTKNLNICERFTAQKDCSLNGIQSQSISISQLDDIVPPTLVYQQRPTDPAAVSMLLGTVAPQLRLFFKSALH